MGYRLFAENTTFADAVEIATYTFEALDAYPEPELRSLAKPLVKLLDQESALLIAHRKARRATIRANARVRTANGIIDDHIRELAKDALAEVRQDRSAPLFAELFPSRPADIIALSLEPEIPEIERIIKVLERDTTPASLRKAWHKSLGDDVAMGNAALDERKAGAAATSDAFAATDRWIQDCDRVRRSIDGALTTHAADHRLTSDFNDRFFPGAPQRVARKKKGKTPEPPQASPA
jgi:hypothetical protein